MVAPVSGVWLVGPIIVESVVYDNIDSKTSEFLSKDTEIACSRYDRVVVTFDLGGLEIFWPIVVRVSFSIQVEHEVCCGLGVEVIWASKGRIVETQNTVLSHNVGESFRSGKR